MILAATEIQKCCHFFFDVLDNKYGSLSELAILLFMLIGVNLFLRSFLKRLHLKYSAQKKPWQDSFVTALYKPISYYVSFIVITNMMDLINLRINEKHFFLEEHMHQMVIVGGIIAFGWFLMRWRKHILQFMIKRSEHQEIAMDRGKIDIVGKIAAMVILFLVLLLLLEVTGRSVTTLIAFGGVGGLAIAFASQEVIANFFSGVMIYLTRPFAIGDWIHLPERDLEGHVEDIGWYLTRIRTFDKRPVYIPNSIFSKMVVVTPSRMSHRQFKETLGIRYQDMPQVKGIIEDLRLLLEQHHEVDKHLSYDAHLHQFGSYAIEILIEAYLTRVDAKGYADLRQDLLFKIGDIVARHKAEMAFPTTTIDVPLALLQHLKK